jgi:hypothetical protein
MNVRELAAQFIEKDSREGLLVSRESSRLEWSEGQDGLQR